MRISEESPRQGFQIRGAGIATDDKARLIDMLSATGLEQIQVTSFVNPRASNSIDAGHCALAAALQAFNSGGSGPLAQLQIALVAHDQKKDALLDWARRWEAVLARHSLIGTGSTAKLLEQACPSLRVEGLLSGPEGGDMQVGARIVEGQVDVLIFFPDPMNSHPHESDFQALIRVALLKDVLFALSPRSADLLARGIFG